MIISVKNDGKLYNLSSKCTTNSAISTYNKQVEIAEIDVCV